MSKTPFKVLKLRSGDDVVARLIKNTKEFIRLERPMVIKVMHYVEPMQGSKKETIVLYDWMKMTTSNHIDMPRDHVLGIFDANPDIVDAYDMQKRIEDNPSLINKINPQRNPGPGFHIDKIMKIVEERMNAMQEDDIEEEIEFEAGIDFEDIKEMLNDARKKGGKKQIEIVDEEDTTHPDYGTRYTDWSPNVDDYLT